MVRTKLSARLEAEAVHAHLMSGDYASAVRAFLSVKSVARQVLATVNDAVQLQDNTTTLVVANVGRGVRVGDVAYPSITCHAEAVAHIFIYDLVAELRTRFPDVIIDMERTRFGGWRIIVNAAAKPPSYAFAYAAGVHEVMSE